MLRQTTKLDPQKTIFVGALHGMINAEGLAHIMHELFGGVVYAGKVTNRTPDVTISYVSTHFVPCSCFQGSIRIEISTLLDLLA